MGPLTLHTSLQGDHVESQQAIGFEIIKALEDPVNLPLGMGLGLHPTVMIGDHGIKVAILDQEQATRLKANGKIDQSLVKIRAG